jgi:hypothetical protein
VYRRILLAVLGTLFIACDRADLPVAPNEPSTLDAVAAAGADVGAVYTGRGTAVDASVRDVRTKLCDTGPLPREGGRIENKEATAAIASMLSASSLYCITLGALNKGISEATAFGLDLTVGGNTIRADRVHSMASGRCPPVSKVPNSAGTSFVTNLRVNGRAVAVVPVTWNQRINLPNGFIVFNEQTSFASPWHAGRTVIGLRIVINRPVPTADIVIARSQTHIDCP